MWQMMAGNDRIMQLLRDIVQFWVATQDKDKPQNSSCSQLRSLTSSTVFLSKKDKIEIKDEKTTSKEETTNKLNDLLQLMIQKEDDTPKDVKLPQAVKRKKMIKEKELPLGKKLEVAAKDVAASLGGEPVKTESELLNILLRSPDPSTQSLKDVLTGIKVDKTKAPPSRAQQVRDTLARETTDRRNEFEKPTYRQRRDEFRKPTKKSAAMVDILGATPTAYFKGLKPAPAPCELQTWKSCVAKDLRLAVTHPPKNIYEQMIQWTDQGIMWHFPIDNQQGLEDEKKVSFEEHIFLEQHLEGWCPERGPVRNFMELVCIGLSKNHWLTVEEKKDYIFWYRDYFNQKNELLNELGAGTIKIESEQQDLSK